MILSRWLGLCGREVLILSCRVFSATFWCSYLGFPCRPQSQGDSNFIAPRKSLNCFWKCEEGLGKCNLVRASRTSSGNGSKVDGNCWNVKKCDMKIFIKHFSGCYQLSIHFHRIHWILTPKMAQKHDTTHSFLQQRPNQSITGSHSHRLSATENKQTI